MSPEQSDADGDRTRDAMALAVLDALHRGEPTLPELRVCVSAYARARRRSGKRPEEVVLELKSVVASVANSAPLRPRGAPNVLTAVSERAVRFAIVAYFDD